ncbi:MAG: DUF4382 domain-containing protein [Nitrospiraceae bacterium]
MNNLKNNSKPLIWFMGLLLTAVIAGCGSDGGGSTQPGTLGVSMTDAPACGFDAVNVTVSKVRVHQSGSADDTAAGWTDITLDPPRTINLLDLNDPTQAPNFALENLGETPLEAGHYTQLRLVLAPNSGGAPFANSVVLAGIPGEIALDTPSAVQSGIKLIHQFTVGSGQRVDLLLDFDACHSVVQTGNGKYKLKPVIKVIPFVLNGIEGFVDTALLNSHVVVSAQVNGNIVRATVPNTVTGKFFLAHLTPTNHDVVITADAHAIAVVSGVPVPDSTTTIISTNTEPISLGGSTTHSIGGTVTLDPPTDEETVFVAAKQTLNNGPTVTVKSLPATPLATVQTGDFSYGLTLPTGAPSLGSYSTGLPLPIELTEQPAAVGVNYTVQASAIGYQTQPLNIVDISTVNTPQNFTLTP